MRQCNMVAASADGGELLKPFVDRKEELTQSWHHAHQFEFVHLKCYEPIEAQRARGRQWSFTRATPSHRLFRAAHESLCDHVNFVNRLGIVPYPVYGSIFFAIRTCHASALGIKDLLTISGESHA